MNSNEGNHKKYSPQSLHIFAGPESMMLRTRNVCEKLYFPVKQDVRKPTQPEHNRVCR